MPDRTELAIHAVTAGLVLLGLVLFVRHLVLKKGWPRRFEPADFGRSFVTGFLRIRPLAIVFVVLALAQAAQTVVYLQAAWRNFSAEDRPFLLVLYSSQLLTGFLGVSAAASGTVWAVERVLRPILVPVLLTATLPACLSPTFRATLAKTLRWWKQDLLFFLLLAIAAGSASGLFSLLLRFGFSGLSDGSFVGRAIYNVLDAEIGLAMSFCAFCCILGRWLQRRESEEPVPAS